MSRPNFLLFITDQQRADSLGCAGHPVLRTPHIDALAARGTRFTRFYVANPICMPNRATLMTGRPSSVHGVRHNGLSLPLTSNTFVDLLRLAGYRTGLIGKSHLQNATDVEPLLTFPPPRPGEAPPPPGHREARLGEDGSGAGYRLERRKSWTEQPSRDIPRPYYGFDHVELALGHGDRAHGHYARWLAERHPDPESLLGPANATPSDTVCPQAWRTRLPEELHHSSYIAERSVAFLQDHARDGGDAPFFLQCSFADPHHPFTPPGRYWDMYDPGDIALPASFATPDADEIPPVRHLRRALADGTADRSAQSAFAVTRREAREAIALTCGMISMIDDCAGRVLRELERTGLADDTVVIFTSDHGDFLGDHGLLLKGPLHFQSLIKVPFIWAEPGASDGGCTSDSLSGTVDIARTVLDRAGVQPYNGMQGRSLIGDLRGDPAGAPEAMLIEEDGQRRAYGFDRPVRARTVVTDRYRLTIYRGEDWGILHDLEADPFEMRNLWDDPTHAQIRARMFERLAVAQMEACDTSPLPAAVA